MTTHSKVPQRSADFTPTTLSIDGVTRMIENLNRQCTKYQEFRELWQNAADAGATRIEFGPAFNFGAQTERLVLSIADNGKGFTPDDLVRFSLLAEPEHLEHFGLGVKISAAPWNHLGIAVWSRSPENISADNPTGTILGVYMFKAGQGYGLENDEDTGLHFYNLTEDDVTYGGVTFTSQMPEWIGEHGTVITLLGSGENDVTLYGSPSVSSMASSAPKEGLDKAMAYLQSRYLDLSSFLDVKIETKFHCWGKGDWGKGATRTATGLCGVMNQTVTAEDGSKIPRVQASGEVALKTATVSWMALNKETTNTSAVSPFIGYMVDGEVVMPFTHKNTYGRWNIPATHRGRLFLLVTPTIPVVMNQERSNIIVLGGDVLPDSEWQEEWTNNIPAELQAIFDAERPETSHATYDEYARGTIARFGEYFKGWFTCGNKKGDDCGDQSGGGRKSRKTPVQIDRTGRQEPIIPGIEKALGNGSGEDVRQGNISKIEITFGPNECGEGEFAYARYGKSIGLKIEIDRSFRPLVEFRRLLLTDMLGPDDRKVDALDAALDEVLITHMYYKLSHYMSTAPLTAGAELQEHSEWVTMMFYGIVPERNAVATVLGRSKRFPGYKLDKRLG